MSNFSFVKDKTLEKNLDTVFDHILDLSTLSTSISYRGKTTLVSSLRKTIIIYTASIIEALLLWKLKQKIKNRKIKLSGEWKYFDIKVLHIVKNPSREIVAGKRKLEEKSVDRLDFVRIIDLALKYEIVGESLSKKLDKVRKLRNRLHVGG
ncbi:hypothetical protein KKB40_04100, partial [Patescibacteria group bacterium]|nr:hypothetical protein [Patescibacteria group bacterium]